MIILIKEYNMPNGPEHQKLVQALVSHFSNALGFKVLSANMPGFNAPIKQGRHEPDIIAIDKDGVINLAEAKISEDFPFQQTREQFIDFSNRVMTGSNRPVPFHIIVYKKDESALRSVLNSLGLGQYIGIKIKIWTL